MAHTTVKVVLAVGIAGLALAALHRVSPGYQRSQVQVSKPAVSPSLIFTESKINFHRQLPGTYKGQVGLRNLSSKTLTDVQLHPTCYCLEITSPMHIARIAPGATVTIPFKANAIIPRFYHQALYASSLQTKETTHVDVVMDVLSPFPELTADSVRLAAFGRETALTPTRPVSTHIAAVPEVLTAHLAANIPWMHIVQRLKRGQLEIHITADGNAPEGPFDVPTYLIYTTKTGEHILNVTLSGQIQSRVQTDPPTLTFGIVQTHTACAPLQCRIALHKVPETPLKIVCNSTRIHAHMEAQDASHYLLSATIDPAIAGEINGSIQLKSGGRLVSAVPVSAFVQR